MFEKPEFTVTLIGGSGAPNYGDELIALNWLEYLRDDVGPRLASMRVHMDNNNAGNSAALFHERFAGVTFRAQIKTHRMTRDAVPLMAHLQHGLTFFDDGQWRRQQPLTQALEALADSDLVHLYGGGYINSRLSPHNAYLLGLLAAAHRRFGVRVVATGQGLTPLDLEPGDDAQPLVDAIHAFETFEVRDVHSARRLRELGVGGPGLVEGLDDAFLQPVRLARETAAAPVRRLHLSSYRAGNTFEPAAVREWLVRVAPEFDEVCYWFCCPWVEKETVADLQTLLPSLRVIDVESLLFDGVPVTRGDHMLTMRYHPHLMAARAGAGGQYVAQNVYYQHKHQAVVAAGSMFLPLDLEAPGQPLAPGLAAPHSQVDEERWLTRKRALAARIYGASQN